MELEISSRSRRCDSGYASAYCEVFELIIEMYLSA
jgi:hypothetical protein